MLLEGIFCYMKISLNLNNYNFNSISHRNQSFGALYAKEKTDTFEMKTASNEYEEIQKYIDTLGVKVFLTQEEQRRYERELQYEGERKEAARNILLLSYMPFVEKIAMKYQKAIYAGNMSMTDAFQEGCLGLLYSIDRFDINKGCSFSDFVKIGIESFIKNALCDKNFLIRLPRNQKEKYLSLRKSYFEELKKKGRAVSYEEFSKKTGVPVDELVFLFNVNSPVQSLNKKVPFLDNKEEIIDFIEDKESKSPAEQVNDKFIEEEFKDKFFKSLDKILSEKEKFVLLERYGLNDNEAKTLESVGKKMNCSRQNVNMIEKNALKKIKKSKEIKELFNVYFEEN